MPEPGLRLPVDPDQPDACRIATAFRSGEQVEPRRSRHLADGPSATVRGSQIQPTDNNGTGTPTWQHRDRAIRCGRPCQTPRS